jgi:hypothetical protein
LIWASKRIKKNNTGMDQSINLNMKDYKLFCYSASLVFHIILFIICFMYLNKNEERYSGKGIDVQLVQQGGNLSSNKEDVIKSRDAVQAPDKVIADNDAALKGSTKELHIQNKSEALANIDMDTITASGFYNFSRIGNDTSALEQVYSEKTLNVKIKYPLGWKFVDQDRRNKLDGVTFWAGNGIFNPPPYIFLEVKEKYLFNPSRYKFNSKMGSSTAYYNDPVELEGQVSQVFYIRTSTDEDYSIKLIMNGRDTFIAFQPIFFSMIKSFNFGKSIF